MNPARLTLLLAVSFFAACGGVPPTSESQDGGVGEVTQAAVQCPSWDPYCEPDGGGEHPENPPPPAPTSGTLSLRLKNPTSETAKVRVALQVNGSVVVFQIYEVPANGEQFIPALATMPFGALYNLDLVWTGRGGGTGGTMRSPGIDCVSDRTSPSDYCWTRY